LPNIQPFVFLTPGVNNTKEACSGFLNLEDWKLSVDPNVKVTETPVIPENTTAFEVPSEMATEPPKSKHSN
jgi:hypothetical protein